MNLKVNLKDLKCESLNGRSDDSSIGKASSNRHHRIDDINLLEELQPATVNVVSDHLGGSARPDRRLHDERTADDHHRHCLNHVSPGKEKDIQIIAKASRKF